MKEDHFQIIRWGIPGWCFLSFTAAFFSINHYVTGANPSIVDGFIGVFEDKNSVMITLIIGSSIPIGFLIYQIHHYLWWNLCYFASEWTIDLSLIPETFWLEDRNQKLLITMNADLYEERRIKIWARILATISYFPFPHLSSFDSWNPRIRYQKRYEALNFMRARKNKWVLANMTWQVKHPDDNSVRKRNYLFGSLGTITFAAGCAFLLFLFILLLNWNWNFTSLTSRHDVVLYSLWILIIAISIALFVSLFIKGILWIQRMAKWKIGVGFQTTTLLWSVALLVFAEFFVLSAFPWIAKHFLGFVPLPENFAYPVGLRYVASVLISLGFTIIVIASCRGNRRDVVKERNLRIAHGLYEEYTELVTLAAEQTTE